MSPAEHVYLPLSGAPHWRLSWPCGAKRPRPDVRVLSKPAVPRSCCPEGRTAGRKWSFLVRGAACDSSCASRTSLTSPHHRTVPSSGSFTLLCDDRQTRNTSCFLSLTGLRFRNLSLVFVYIWVYLCWAVLLGMKHWCNWKKLSCFLLNDENMWDKYFSMKSWRSFLPNHFPWRKKPSDRDKRTVSEHFWWAAEHCKEALARWTAYECGLTH